MFKLAINSEWGPGVSTRLASFVRAIPALLILFSSVAYSQTATDAIRASIAPTTPPTQQGPPPVKIIEMNDDMPMYQPNSIFITAGQTVEWHNSGQVSHSVVDDASRAKKPDDALLPAGAKPFSSGNVMPGGSYRHTFTAPGRYRYFCMSHEMDDMVGEVVVRPAPPAAEPMISQAKSQPWKSLEHGGDTAQLPDP